MSTGEASKPRSVGKLIEDVTVPPNAVGMFWLGGNSLALKSQKQQVYLIDPAFSQWDGGGPVGTIDVRPDLVICSLKVPGGLDLSTLTHISTAFSEVRFVGSDAGRDWMIGRGGIAKFDEVPVDPEKVKALQYGDRVDVRRLHVRDAVSIRMLPGADVDEQGCWNFAFTFSGLQICVIREVFGSEGLEELCGALPRRIDVLIWSLTESGVAGAQEVIGRLAPRYAIPVGYDHLKSGRSIAREFRTVVDGMSGVKAYLFAQDYMEGLVYSRIMSRRR